MKRYLKTLEEELEVVVDGSGVYTTRRCSESMDVQLDRWRMEQRAREERVTVIRYDLSTSVEGNPDGSGSTIINTMSVLYARADELIPYGVIAGMDPVEWVMYETIGRQIGAGVVAGRVLFLCPSPLMRYVGHSDVEMSSRKRGESNPETYGTGIYDAVVADRELSRCIDPEAAVEAVKRALHPGGVFLVLEDGHVNRGALRAFSPEGLGVLLRGFEIAYSGTGGNTLSVIHKLSCAGSWMPTQLDPYMSPDPECPAYAWILAKK